MNGGAGVGCASALGGTEGTAEVARVGGVVKDDPE